MQCTPSMARLVPAGCNQPKDGRFTYHTFTFDSTSRIWKSKPSTEIETAAYTTFGPIRSNPGVCYLALAFSQDGHTHGYKVRAKSTLKTRHVVLTKDSYPADEMIIVPGDKREGILQELDAPATRAALSLAAARRVYQSRCTARIPDGTSAALARPDLS